MDKKIKPQNIFIALGIFLSLILLILSFCAGGITSLKDIFTKKENLEQISTLWQIVSAYFVIVGAAIAIWQYTMTATAERNKIEKDNIGKAIELSEYYKDNILSIGTMINYIYREVGICNIIDRCDINNMCNFDHSEIPSVISKDSRLEIEEINRSEKLLKTIMKADLVYGMELNVEKYVEMEKNGSNTTIGNIRPDAILRHFFANCVSEVLNNMEYFALHFTHGVADDTVVYQSLHQTYIQFVQLLYYEIANKNKDGCHDYYTNVIGLYNKWHERSVSQELSVTASKRNSKHRGTVAKRR